MARCFSSPHKSGHSALQELQPFKLFVVPVRQTGRGQLLAIAFDMHAGPTTQESSGRPGSRSPGPRYRPSPAPGHSRGGGLQFLTPRPEPGPGNGNPAPRGPSRARAQATRNRCGEIRRTSLKASRARCGPGCLSNWVFDFLRLFSICSGHSDGIQGLLREFEGRLTKLEGLLATLFERP